MLRTRTAVSFAALVLLSPLAIACGKKSSDDAAASKKTDKKTDKNSKARGDKGGEKGEAKDNDKTKAPGSGVSPPRGLKTSPPIPSDNLMNTDKIALGHKLFMDSRLSVDGSRSCYTCHQNELGNADGRATAIGAANKPLTRNTPTIWNVGYHKALYWDGRAANLEAQAIGAWKGGNMGVGDGLEAKAAEIGALPEYADTFRNVFELGKDDPVRPEHIAKAISAYERTLNCGDTAYDKAALSESATRGEALFYGKAACMACHNGENLTDGLFHNVGLEADEQGKVREGADIGHGKVAGDEAKNFTFRTPTLRNVARTAPYFHNGSVATLEEAVRFMAKGGNVKAPGIDPILRDVKLSDAEIKDVVAFLEALSCDGKLEVVGEQPKLPPA